MGKGKHKQYGESPAEILLKRKLGNEEFQRRQAELRGQRIKIRNDAIEMIQSFGAFNSPFANGTNTEIDPAIIQAFQDMQRYNLTPQHIEELRDPIEDWCDKWMEGNNGSEGTLQEI